jgi:thymidine kinase
MYKNGQLSHYSFQKTDNDKLVMLGETEEYEPWAEQLTITWKNQEEKNGD